MIITIAVASFIGGCIVGFVLCALLKADNREEHDVEEIICNYLREE